MGSVFLDIISFIMITELNRAQQTLLSLIWGNLCQMFNVQFIFLIKRQPKTQTLFTHFNS